jgi:amidophosphoribosyltransferase
VDLLREAGATEVHVRISSPPVKNPCFYGIDTPTKAQLVASSHTIEQIRTLIGADSLTFLSAQGMMKAIGRPTGNCLACFTGEYPTAVEEEVILGGEEDEPSL